MNKLLAVAAVGGALVVTSAVRPVSPPGPRVADFFVEVTNRSPYRVEIGVSYAPNQSRRAGFVPSNATKRLKASWRETPFVVVITAKGAGTFDARGGAHNDDAVLYTDVLTVEEDGQVEVEIPARLPGPYLRTQRP